MQYKDALKSDIRGFLKSLKAKADMKRLRRKTSSALICYFAPLVRLWQHVYLVGTKA